MLFDSLSNIHSLGPTVVEKEEVDRFRVRQEQEQAASASGRRLMHIHAQFEFRAKLSEGNKLSVPPQMNPLVHLIPGLSVAERLDAFRGQSNVFQAP